MTALLALLACSTDPLTNPAFIPPTEDAVRVAITPPERSFRVGEPIPLDLVVSVTGMKGGNAFDTTPNTARGRLAKDIWTVRPSGGVTDPGVWWQDTGGRLAPRSVVARESSPATATVTLNDWIRFDRPGTYGVQLHTERAGGFSVSTNAVRLTVTPRDPAADAARAQALVAALDGPEGDAAAMELGWIGSPETLALAVDRLTGPAPDAREDAWIRLLSMHPDAPRAAAELDRRISDPSAGVHLATIAARVAVGYVALHAEPIGDVPVGQPEPEVFRFRAVKERREGDRAELRAAALARLAEALPKKSPEARGAALATLASSLSQPPAPWQEAVVAAARAELATLPEPVVVRLLESPVLDDPSAAPGLAAVVRSSMASSTRHRALERLVAVDRAAAAPVIEALVADPARGVTPEADRILRGLPAVSAETAAALVAGIGRAADPVLHLRLVATYVGPEHADAVHAAWTATPADAPTGVIAGYAAYFLRHQPQRAEPILARWDAVHYDLLGLTGELVPDPERLVPRAWEALVRSPEENVYLKASDYLREHADPSYLPKLIEVLPNTKDRRQEAVANAIAASRAWAIDVQTRNACIRVIRDRLADRVLRNTAGADDPALVFDARVVDGEPVFTVNYQEYRGVAEVETKLAQFQRAGQIILTWHDTPAAEAHRVFGPIIERTKVPVTLPPAPE